MEYLITGGAGFIGSHLADALLARGDSVLALDDLSTGAEANVRHLFDYPLRAARGVDLGSRPRLEAGEQRGRDRPPSGRRRGQAHRGASSRFPPHEHPGHRDRPRRGRRARLQGPHHVDLRDLRKNASGPLKEDDDRILGSPFKARWSYSTSKAVDEILARGYWRDRGLRPSSSGCSTRSALARQAPTGWSSPASCTRPSGG